MIANPLDLCLMCAQIRAKISELKKWFEDNRYLLKCIEHKEIEQKWIGFHLNYIINSSNDIIDRMNRVENSVLRLDKLDPIYQKLIESEIRYFTDEYTESIKPRLAGIRSAEQNHVLKTHESYDLIEYKKLDASMANNENLIKEIAEYIESSGDKVTRIEDNTRSALFNVKTGRRRIERAKTTQTRINRLKIVLIVTCFLITAIILIIVIFVLNLFLQLF